MTIVMKRALLLAPAVLVVSAAALADTTPAKCGGQNTAPLVAIDGVITALHMDSIMQQVPRENLYSLAIVCMNPQDSTFNRRQGINVISLWTVQGPAPRVKTALGEIRDAQAAYFAREGRFATTLKEIAFHDPTGRLTVSLDADDKGWTARATVPRLLETCAVSGGAAAPEPGAAGEIRCFSD